MPLPRALPSREGKASAFKFAIDRFKTRIKGSGIVHQDKVRGSRDGFVGNEDAGTTDDEPKKRRGRPEPFPLNSGVGELVVKQSLFLLRSVTGRQENEPRRAASLKRLDTLHCVRAAVKADLDIQGAFVLHEVNHWCSP